MPIFDKKFNPYDLNDIANLDKFIHRKNQTFLSKEFPKCKDRFKRGILKQTNPARIAQSDRAPAF